MSGKEIHTSPPLIQDKPPVLNKDEISQLWGERKVTDYRTFKEKCSIIHGGWYIYKDQPYVSTRTPIIIQCPIHGDFEQTPKMHLRGKGGGCKKCSSDQRRSSNFIEKAVVIHNNFYDYSMVEYVTSNADVIIKCPVHGEFKQTPNTHLRGSGCRKCSIEKITTSIEEFKTKAERIHGNSYCYDKVTVLENIHTPVVISCPVHGDFKQSPSSHIHQAARCPKCAKIQNVKEIKLHKMDVPAILYHIVAEIDGQKFQKIGITRKTINDRFKQYKFTFKVIDKIETNLYNAIILESRIKEWLDHNGLLGASFDLKGKLDGWTECFPIDIEFKIEEYQK